MYIDIDIYNSNVPPKYSKDSMKTWCWYFDRILICFCLWDLIFVTSGSVVEVGGPLMFWRSNMDFQNYSGQSFRFILEKWWKHKNCCTFHAIDCCMGQPLWLNKAFLQTWANHILMGQIPALPSSGCFSGFRSPVKEESSAVLRMGIEDPNALLWALLYEGNMSNLQKLTPDLVDFRALHPKTGVTVIVFVIERALEQVYHRPSGSYEYPVQIITWLLRMGADATQKVSSRWIYRREVAISSAGHSAVSYLVEIQSALEELGSRHRGTYTKDFVKAALATIAASVPAEAMHQKVSINQSLMARWEGIFNDTSTHNVTLETADNQVTAHDWMLREASPVLKVMLESSMQLGSGVSSKTWPNRLLRSNETNE